MFRSLTSLAIAACFWLMPQLVSAEGVVSAANDSAQIYQSFLDGWTGKEKSPINVSSKAEAPTAEDLKQFADCSGNPDWMPVKTESDISSLVAALPYVRLVDPDKWSPVDPGDLIAKGKPVKSAVRSGVDHGLLTFSAIAFDGTHKTAAFTYSFVCGRLCGNGGAVIFKATSSGWVRGNKQCGGWMSQAQRGRSNNSFKPTPLRGSA